MSAEQQSVLLVRAESARERAQALMSARADLLVRHRRTMSACLITRTAVIDAGCGVSEQRTRDLKRLSELVGRDPSIEAEKAVIADRYGFTSGEAFELLRHMSQTGNRKLRDVAHGVLEAHPRTPA